MEKTRAVLERDVLKKFREENSKLRMLIRGVPCGLCEQPVGKGHEFFGSAVYCQNCLCDVGGEGGV